MSFMRCRGRDFGACPMGMSSGKDLLSMRNLFLLWKSSKFVATIECSGLWATC